MLFNQYVLILVWIGLMALIQWRFYREEYNELTGEYEWRVTPFFAFIAFFPIIWMAGHRGWDGVFDTGLYIRYFWEMPSSLANLSSYLQTISKDVGFFCFSALIKIFMGANEDLYFTIIALVQGLCIIYLFRRNTPDYVTAVFLFVVSTDYLSGMFNGIRQFVAVALIYATTSLVLKKKYVAVFFMILLASTFHQSALIMIPIILISQGKAWNRRTLLFIGAMLLSVVFVGEFTGLLDTVLQETQYANVVTDYNSWNDDGTNPLRVLVYSIPCILSFFLRDKIVEEQNPQINYFVNMSIITMGLYVLSMFTSGIFMGRLPIYCNLYCYMLLPWELKKLGEYQNKRILNFIMVGCYLLFYYYITHFQYGIV